MRTGFAAAIGLILTSVATCAAPSGSSLVEVMGRPNYRAAYDRMLKGEPNLPKWMATSAAVADATSFAGKTLTIGGATAEFFEVCEPNNCGRTGLIVMFTDNGNVAKGLLSEKVDVFFGHPSPSEAKLLLTMIDDD